MFLFVFEIFGKDTLGTPYHFLGSPSNLMVFDGFDGFGCF